MTSNSNRRFGLVAAALILLGACSSPFEKPQSQETLALACQLTKCTCVGVRSSILASKKTESVLFRSTGAAYCPEGFELQRLDK